jgi:DNA polymerase
MPAQVALVGEGPGPEEDKYCTPFIGMTGRLLTRILLMRSLDEDSCYITNVVKCKRPAGNPTRSDAAICKAWLDTELALVQPDIIMAMGALAIRDLTDLEGNVEHLHGRPIRVDAPWLSEKDREQYHFASEPIPQVIIIPAYHPAAGLYDTATLRHIFADFDVLKKIVDGMDPYHEDIQPRDKHPIPAYRTVSCWEESAVLIKSGQEYALDTETVNNKLWSYQISTEPGTATFVPVSVVSKFFAPIPPGAVAVTHNYLYDREFIKIGKFVDTMTAAYLLGYPQALKELASRYCGMDMQSYPDLVAPYRQKKAREYLDKITVQDWGPPVPVTETSWNNKLGRIHTRMRKPQPLNRKIRRMLADCATKDTDLYKRWHDIDPSERAVAEAMAGPMPDATIADVETKAAVWYACRDADATLRASHDRRDEGRWNGYRCTMAPGAVREVQGHYGQLGSCRLPDLRDRCQSELDRPGSCHAPIKRP